MKPASGRTMRWVMPAAVAVAMCSCAAVGQAADQPPAGPTVARPDGPAGGKAGGTHPAKSAGDSFFLPPDYKNADGTFNQESIAAQQRRRAEAINARLHTRLRVSETPHYILFSDADAAMTAQFTKWCEALYGNLCTQFGIEPKERVWDGKCVLMIFSGRPAFEAFARQFDEQDVRDAGAYFAWESFPPGDPQLVHICIPLDERDPRRLQELFAHEGTHAFFQLYRRPVALPLWLHEGLAEFMAVVNDPSLKARKSGAAMAIARAGSGIQHVLACQMGEDLKIPEYSVAYTLVDYLQRMSRTKFKDLVRLLKEGKTVDAAMQAAYGFDCAGMEKRWRASLAAEVGTGQKRR